MERPIRPNPLIAILVFCFAMDVEPLVMTLRAVSQLLQVRNLKKGHILPDLFPCKCNVARKTDGFAPIFSQLCNDPRFSQRQRMRSSCLSPTWKQPA
jgi:hypothetical protein